MTESDHRLVRIAAAVLVLAACLCYRNTLLCPFVFDDVAAVTQNATIRHLTDFHRLFFPPAAATTAGRPLLNLSFALNYAIGGTSVLGYHAFNLGLLIASGLVLFGIVRRTLGSPRVCAALQTAAIPLGWLIAWVWTVHPLLTEAVTYVSQRAEAMMGLFYLLTLYGFIRGSRGWRAVSVAACFAGMASKEGMVTAPVMVLLYDRAFVAESFRSLFAARRKYYLALAASWILLAGLMATSGLSHRGVGPAAGLPWWRYPLVEAHVVCSYAKLAIWPRPLVFDYGLDLLLLHRPHPLLYVAAIVVAVGATVLLWFRSPAKAFPAVWFFLALAPSSSVVPLIVQPMAESRMYLALAGPVVLVAVGGYVLFRRAALVGLIAAAMLLGRATIMRNRDYASAIGLWRDTVAKAPNSSRAHDNLAELLLDEPGQVAQALHEYRIALRIRPSFAQAECGYGNALLRVPGAWREAIEHYERSLQLDPENATAEYDLATALAVNPQRRSDAIAHYERALQLDPESPEAHNNLGILLMQDPARRPEAVRELETAVWLNPAYCEARNNFGNYLAQNSVTLPEAIEQFEASLAVRPDAAIENRLGIALAKVGRLDEALLHWQAAVRLDPRDAAARKFVAQFGPLAAARAKSADASP